MKKNKIRQIIREQIRKLHEQSSPNDSWWDGPNMTANNSVFNSIGLNITDVDIQGINEELECNEAIGGMVYGGYLDYSISGNTIEFSQSEFFLEVLSNMPPNTPVSCILFMDNNNCSIASQMGQDYSWEGSELDPANLISFLQENNIEDDFVLNGCFGNMTSSYFTAGEYLQLVDENQDLFGTYMWGAIVSQRLHGNVQSFGSANVQFDMEGEINRPPPPPPPEFDCEGFDLNAFAASLNLTVSVFCHDCLYVYDANILANVGDECGCCDGYRPPRPEEKYSFCCDQDAQNYGMDANGVSINGTVTWPIEGPGFGGNYVDTYLMLGGIPDNMAQCNNDICEYDDIDKEGCSEMIDDTHPLWPDCVKCWTNGFETSATGPDCECCRPMQKRYRCDKGWGAMAGNVECVTDPNGEFESLAACQEGCRGGDTHVLRPPRDGAGDDLVNLFQKRAGIKPQK